MSSPGSTTIDVTIISPEEDAKRILTDLLASENIRTAASRIASGVIQSPPFQNACLVLVKNILDDLINDPETTSQLTALVYNVLQNEKIYAAVKDLVHQLVNDEEVYRELTKLVVKLGEEQEVLDATQQLLTESAHKTLNDPSVLDHSMEFATEVVGDDVVQRTGGEALRNTVGYAVQPSGSAVLTGIGTGIVAGVLYFYLSRRGGGEGGPTGTDDLSNVSSHPQLPMQFVEATPTDMNGTGRGTFGCNPSNENLSAMDVAHKIVIFPSVLMGSIHASVSAIITFSAYAAEKCSAGWEQLHGKLSNGVVFAFNIPSQIGSFPAYASGKCSEGSKWLRGKLLDGAVFVLNVPSRIGSSTIAFASSASLWAFDKLSAILYNCQSGVAGVFQIFVGNTRNVPNYVKDRWTHLVMTATEYLFRMRGNDGISPTPR
eukprot:CAMPEP_0172575038 /NCGR_PEP_ID=MMETSP1067-20121228/137010_1 /TAXON_ID=265564 ORGANISM="Thalassiosira punctigera, Strain Tpunct2005C2" /NCGR_SAMPLE_ID=MMETSP1067 /ASSEMBLY_ACC=CAM_ASM_000444 /LENGTH=430 /DNA_ID=CAMNT_0013367681 /DNA_START=661 /DNA_END=1953 /DNA_ORIENTATION=-